MRIGQRVRIKQDLDFYPHFVLRAGVEGTVVEVNERCVWVRMAETIEGCEEWLNEVHFDHESTPPERRDTYALVEVSEPVTD